jgi:class 3 adenylate cyclase
MGIIKVTQSRKNVLNRPNVTKLWSTLVAIAMGAVFSGINMSGIGRYLDEWLAERVDFQIRDLLGQTPTISPRLKILVLDDPTFANLGDWVMPIEQWAILLEAIDARKPQAIFIDEVWSKVVDPNHLLEESLKILSKRTTPIIVGAKALPDLGQVMPFSLDFDWRDFSLAKRANPELAGVANPLQDVRLKDYSHFLFAGPSPDLSRAVDHAGHILYEGGGRVEPLLKRDFATIVPHAFLYTAKDWNLNRDSLTIDGEIVHLDSDGMIPINFLNPGPELYKNGTILSLGNFIRRARLGQPLERINAGDMVIILPLFFTGSTDFKWTPYGSIPAGFIPASLINSVLEKQWLRPFGNQMLLVVCAVTLGIFTAVWSGAVTFWISFATTGLLLFCAVVILFSFMSVQISWFVPGLAYLASALTVYAKKIRTGEEKIWALRQALEGSIASDGLTEILKNPEQVQFEPRPVIVSLMFVDIVGFSKVSEAMTPQAAFDSLKVQLDLISRVIHEFGGRIDRTLGDGMLCYFGFNTATNGTTIDHSEKAVGAALKIQEDNILRLMAKGRHSLSPLPLRIGVHTAECVSGNLGSGHRIDFTVIGNGVNLAKRLEDACEPNRVLISKMTFDLVRGLQIVKDSVVRRDVKIKHHAELMEAYDLDPSARNPSFQSFIRQSRVHKEDAANRDTHRIVIREGVEIRVKCSIGEGRLKDFSLSGFSLALPLLLEKNAVVEFSLYTLDSRLTDLLESKGLKNLVGEVRWAFSEGNDHVHGLSINGLDSTQQRILYELLHNYLFEHSPRGIAS